MKICEHTTSGEPFWLERLRRDFIQSLATLGYAESSIVQYQHISIRLCKAAKARGVTLDDLDTEIMNELAEACSTTGSPDMESRIRTVASRLTRYLVEVGVSHKCCVQHL